MLHEFPAADAFYDDGIPFGTVRGALQLIRIRSSGQHPLPVAETLRQSTVFQAGVFDEEVDQIISMGG